MHCEGRLGGTLLRDKGHKSVTDSYVVVVRRRLTITAFDLFEQLADVGGLLCDAVRLLHGLGQAIVVRAVTNSGDLASSCDGDGRRHVEGNVSVGTSEAAQHIATVVVAKVAGSGCCRGGGFVDTQHVEDVNDAVAVAIGIAACDGSCPEDL